MRKFKLFVAAVLVVTSLFGTNIKNQDKKINLEKVNEKDSILVNGNDEELRIGYLNHRLGSIVFYANIY